MSLTTSVLVDKAALAGDSALQDLARLEQLAGAEALALTRELPAADAVRLHSVGVVLGSGSG